MRIRAGVLGLSLAFAAGAAAAFAPARAGANEDAPEAARSPSPRSEAAPLYGFQFNCLTSLASWDRAERGEPYALNSPPNALFRIWDSAVVMPEGEGTRDEGMFIGDESHSFFYRVADLLAKDPRAPAPEASPGPATKSNTLKLSWWTGANTYYNFEIEKFDGHWKVVSAFGPSGESRPEYVPIQGRKNDPFLAVKGISRESDFRTIFSSRMAIYVSGVLEQVKATMASPSRTKREKSAVLFMLKATMKECRRLSHPGMERAAAEALDEVEKYEKSLTGSL